MTEVVSLDKDEKNDEGVPAHGDNSIPGGDDERIVGAPLQKRSGKIS